MAGKSIHWVRTAQGDGERLSNQAPLAFTNEPAPDVASITVDDGTRFQTIEGFGGAFTEAAAVTLYKMPPEKQAEILKAYFDSQEGNGYTLCRTHINSCDFSLGNYAYDEVEGDVALTHFSIDHDRRALIPMIKAAMDVAGDALKLFASPWSPPAWMKTNGEMNHGGKLKPEYRDAWARYYCRYIREYEKEGVPIWGLSVQNEPLAIQTWDSCIYTGEEERDFVRDYLGPTLEREGLADVNLIIWDHNRDLLYERAKAVLDDPKAARYVWGTGFHWYVADCFDNAQRVHDAYPDKHLLFTEGCQEGGPHLGEWAVGERYARSMVNDLNRWTVGWVDWNLVLDEIGGPNHVGNYCSAPIIADTRTGEVFYQSSYDYIGHFSRYIRPGAQRIIAAATCDELETTAFLNPDGQIAVVVLNRTEKDLPFAIKFGQQVAVTDSPAHSIQTY
ncbi:MAG: glycoside hydrolase family 30 protein, partial [Anaerolineae bacterium]